MPQFKLPEVTRASQDNSFLDCRILKVQHIYLSIFGTDVQTYIGMKMTSVLVQQLKFILFKTQKTAESVQADELGAIIYVYF